MASYDTETRRLEFYRAVQFSGGSWCQGVLGNQQRTTRLSQYGVSKLLEQARVILRSVKRASDCCNDYAVEYEVAPRADAILNIDAVDFFILQGRAKKKVMQIRPDGTLQFLSSRAVVNGDVFFGELEPKWIWKEEYIGFDQLQGMFRRPKCFQVETVVKRSHDNYQVVWQEKQ